MGITSEVQSALAEAFDGGDIGELVESFDFVVKDVTPGAYDPATDTYLSEDPAVLSPSRGMFYLVSDKEIDGINILAMDERIVVNGIDVLIEPEVSMKIRVEGGKEYRIIDPGKVVGGSPSAIIHHIHVRANG